MQPKIYRQLLYQAAQIPQYSYREYFLRRIRETYKDPRIANEWSEEKERVAREALEQLKRIVLVQRIYGSGRPLAVEEAAAKDADKSKTTKDGGA